MRTGMKVVAALERQVLEVGGVPSWEQKAELIERESEDDVRAERCKSKPATCRRSNADRRTRLAVTNQ